MQFTICSPKYSICFSGLNNAVRRFDLFRDVVNEDFTPQLTALSVSESMNRYKNSYEGDFIFMAHDNLRTPFTQAKMFVRLNYFFEPEATLFDITGDYVNDFAVLQDASRRLITLETNVANDTWTRNVFDYSQIVAPGDPISVLATFTAPTNEETAIVTSWDGRDLLLIAEAGNKIKLYTNMI